VKRLSLIRFPLHYINVISKVHTFNQINFNITDSNALLRIVKLTATANGFSVRNSVAVRANTGCHSFSVVVFSCEVRLVDSFSLLFLQVLLMHIAIAKSNSPINGLNVRSRVSMFLCSLTNVATRHRSRPSESSTNQGRNEGGKGVTISRAPNHYGGAERLRGRRKVPTISQVLSSTQCICFRMTSGSKMGAPNLLLAPGAI